MKNSVVFIPVFLGVLLFMGSCLDIINPPDEAETALFSPGKGRLAVQIGSAARTALPAGVFDRYVLRFDYNGTEGYVHDAVEWNAGVTVDLDPGNWTVHVDAYAGETVVGTGSAAVTVSPGSLAPVTIRISAIETGAGIRGTLKYRVSYPADEAGRHAYRTDGIYIIAIEDWFNMVDTSVNKPIVNGAEGTEGLEPGVYLVYIPIEDTIQRTAVERMKTVHIYGGQETSLSISIGEDEFTAVIPVTGTTDFTVPAGFTVTSRVIAAYSDLACTDPVGTPETLSTSGTADFTLWIPSAVETVYLRQELGVQDASNQTFALYGNSWIEMIAKNQTRPNVYGQLSDAFYEVSVASGINYGTVTADLPVAAEGATVTVTATANPGYTLKGGSVKYSYGSGDYTPDGNGPYTFTMPGSDVTVSAGFDQPVRYVKAGGTGTGQSWGTASGDLQKMMDELAGVSAAGITGPYIVKVAAGVYKPEWEPMVPSSPGDPSYITPADNRDKAFILRAGVRLWGGYHKDGAPDENLTEFDRKARFTTDGTLKSAYNNNDYKTILSGDFLGNDSTTPLDFSGHTENAYHVVLAMNIPANSGTVLDGFTITGGNANGGGNITITDTTINRNSGGGIYSVSSLLYETSAPGLANLVISGNSASGYGGGIYNVSTEPYTPASPALTNVTISGNSARDGGGMCNYNSWTNSPSSSVLTNVTISGNSADDRGGGIFNFTCSPVLANVTISDSSAPTGGGMYNYQASPVLINVAISGNSTLGSGGAGIYNFTSSSPVLINVAIFGNSASGMSGGGGGIYNATSSSPVLINVVVSGNGANDSGGGIYNFNSSSPVIRNSIIWGNTAATGENVWNNGSNPTFTYSIVEGSGGSIGWDTGFGVDGDNNLDVDPQFENWQNPGSVSMPTITGDYRLKAGSQAINAGSVAGYLDTWEKWYNFFGISGAINNLSKYTTYIAPYIDKDLAGNARKQGAAIDMGAYERQ
jgi:hypothetical protein